MNPGPPPSRRGRLALLLAGGILGTVSLAAHLAVRPALAGGDGDSTPAFEKQVNLVYTVNNFGYIDVCG